MAKRAARPGTGAAIPVRAREKPTTCRLGPGERALLAARLCACALRVCRDLRRRPLPELIARLDRPGRVRLRLEPRRLGRIVYRVMNVGPFRPRCLTMSLVLFRELRRQGTAAEIVIGLPPEPRDHNAHAWVEVDGEVVGPPPGRLEHSEMARYGGERPTAGG